MEPPLDSPRVGYRFSPTNEELVHFLKRKNTGISSGFEEIPEVDICKFEPWDLPDKSKETITRTGDSEWFFFSPIAKKFQKGQRCNRATEAGFWKATGKDRKIKYCSKQIGKIQTLVFYKRRSPKGERTNWIIYEYRVNETALNDTNGSQDAFVLCLLFRKSEEKTEDPCDVESRSFDAVGPSGLSLDTSKSSPEDNLPIETEDPTIKNKIPDLDIEGGPEHLSAVTDSRDPIDISWSWLQGGPDLDTSGGQSFFDYWERTGTFNPYRNADVELSFYNDDKLPIESRGEGLALIIFEDNEDEAEATEARGSIIEPVHDAVHKSFPEQVVTPPVDSSTRGPYRPQVSLPSFKEFQMDTSNMSHGQICALHARPGSSWTRSQPQTQADSPPWIAQGAGLMGYKSTSRRTAAQADSPRKRISVRAQAQGGSPQLVGRSGRSDDPHPEICALDVEPNSSLTRRQPQTRADSPPRPYVGSAGLGRSSTRRPTKGYAYSSPGPVEQSGVPGSSSTRMRPQSRAALRPTQYAVSQGASEHSKIDHLRFRKPLILTGNMRAGGVPTSQPDAFKSEASFPAVFCLTLCLILALLVTAVRRGFNR